jgi:hypothetical protein
LINEPQARLAWYALLAGQDELIDDVDREHYTDGAVDA